MDWPEDDPCTCSDSADTSSCKKSIRSALLESHSISLIEYSWHTIASPDYYLGFIFDYRSSCVFWGCAIVQDLKVAGNIWTVSKMQVASVTSTTCAGRIVSSRRSLHAISGRTAQATLALRPRQSFRGVRGWSRRHLTQLPRASQDTKEKEKEAEAKVAKADVKTEELIKGMRPHRPRMPYP
jgi:hypothetical protein